jgi:hypothetical protein
MIDDPDRPESGSTKTEVALDVASVVTSAVPWIGGPVSSVLSGVSFGRKLNRVREILEGLTEDLRDFKSTVSENYVKTEDFEELLEQALRKAADERSPEKRRLYRAFLSNAVKSPRGSYDDRLRVLRLLEQLHPDGLRVLIALAQTPVQSDAPFGTPLNTLQKRLRDIPVPRIEEIFGELQRLGLANLRNLKVTMTAHGAEDLRHAVTPLGYNVLGYTGSV